jgi:hypothetical protein
MCSSNGHVSSNGSGSDSAGKQNSPNEANDTIEYGSSSHQRNPSLRGKRAGGGRTAADKEGSNPDADPSAGSRKRRISGNSANAYADASSAKPPAEAGPGSRTQAGTGESGCSKGSHGSDGGGGGGSGGGGGGGGGGQDRRWVAGMYVDTDGVPRMPLHDADADYADPIRHGHWAEALITSPLAEVPCRSACVSALLSRSSRAVLQSVWCPSVLVVLADSDAQ